MSAVSAKYTLTAHVQHANTPAMTAPSVSALHASMSMSASLTMPYSVWEMRAQLPHGMPLPFLLCCTAGWLIQTRQHCILEWIKQDSAKGQCPMCRQSKSFSLPVLNMGYPDAMMAGFEWTEQPNETSMDTSSALPEV